MKHPPQRVVRLRGLGRVTFPSAALTGIYRHPISGEIRRLSVKDGHLTIAPSNRALIPLADDHFRQEGTSPDYLRATGPGGRRELRVIDERGNATVYRAAPAATPTPGQLADYAGRFRSPELDTTYTIALRDERLHLQRRKFADEPLEPTIAEGFATDRHQLDFTRNAMGRADGFSLTTGRVRRLRFDRVG